jgi:hypothetical protein
MKAVFDPEAQTRREGMKDEIESRDSHEKSIE